MERSDARKRRAEATLVTDPQVEYMDRIADELDATIARLTTERDGALAQVAAVAALADEWEADLPNMFSDTAKFCWRMAVDELCNALTDPAAVLARRDAEVAQARDGGDRS